MSDNDDFERLTGPFRTELLAHCYRMLGSVHDAEDLVQETYLRAWRSYDAFEGRSSLRTWLYRIATNACLTARESRDRRALPSGLGAPVADPHLPVPAALPEVPWLQPAPDSLFGAGSDDPAAIVVSRHTTRLALVAALQHLPPRQCAVLILRDVLQWRAAEVAELLGTTTAAVNSALQRARAQLELVAPAEDEVVDVPGQRALLDRYVAAVENADTAALVGLLTEDAVWEMPPFASWLFGRDLIGRFLKAQCPSDPGDNLLVPTRANGQPAFGAYLRGADGVHRAGSIKVLTITRGAISRILSYEDPDLFELFGLPPVHPAASPLPSR
ncbi:sigma-70 family RNA polymerase sigma factor [Catellatospora tritici]|uniref:sigma-70 family RNA polymerase sigma factor n=1 Tax=Catellatospora tritici TaxID=2851566 RepID=UPI0020C393D7|nr:sigma-70 family RNA polymerase sigma factor [Catellatospora tritici]